MCGLAAARIDLGDQGLALQLSSESAKPALVRSAITLQLELGEDGQYMPSPARPPRGGQIEAFGFRQMKAILASFSSAIRLWRSRTDRPKRSRRQTSTPSMSRRPLVASRINFCS